MENKLTFEQIIDKLKEIYPDGITEFAYDGKNYNQTDLIFKEVDQYGGERQGDTWYSVKYFPQHDIYIRVDGYYSSYHGTDFNGWEDCKEVRPQQKTIMVYESK